MLRLKPLVTLTDIQARFESLAVNRQIFFRNFLKRKKKLFLPSV